MLTKPCIEPVSWSCKYLILYADITAVQKRVRVMYLHSVYTPINKNHYTPISIAVKLHGTYTRVLDSSIYRTLTQIIYQCYTTYDSWIWSLYCYLNTVFYRHLLTLSDSNPDSNTLPLGFFLSKSCEPCIFAVETFFLLRDRFLSLIPMFTFA
jgi:hypothetical protein